MPIARMVGKENVSEADIDLEAYSYDASCMKLKPAFVVWPNSKEQIRKILIYCNRTSTPIVCRGLGTNLVGSAIGERAIILDFSRMNRILQFGQNKDYVDVEPGVPVKFLNSFLQKHERCFPVFPEEFETTVGGLVSLDLFGPYSAGCGLLSENILEIDFFDGTGKHYAKAELDEVLGWEGTTGIITRVRLKTAKWPLAKSADFFSFNNLPVLFNKLESLKRNPHVISSDFFCKMSSAYMNAEPKYSLLVEYASDEGAIKESQKISQLVNKRKNLYSILRAKQHYFIEDPKLPYEKLYDLIHWCEKQELPCYGHIAFNVLKVMFKKDQAGLREELYSLIREWAGVFSGIYGYGLRKKQYFPPGAKHKLIKLKEKMDYNNILNRGKLVDFR